MESQWQVNTHENQDIYRLYETDDYILEVIHFTGGVFGGSVVLNLDEGLLLNKNQIQALSNKLVELTEIIN